MKRRVQKNIKKFKPHLLSILESQDPNLQVSTMECGYLTRVLRQEIECMKLTACMYNQLSLSSNQIGGQFNVFVKVQDVERHAHNAKNKWINSKILPSHFQVIANPKITSVSNVEIYEYEPSLNFPVIESQIRRHERIKIEYMNENGHTVQEQLDGLSARLFQHNYFQLRGKSILDIQQNHGKVRIKEEFQETQGIQFLQGLLDQYQDLGNIIAKEDPEFYETNSQDLESVKEINNPRVMIEDPQQEIEVKKYIKESQKLYGFISEEIQYLAEFLKIPEKRKVKKMITQNNSNN